MRWPVVPICEKQKRDVAPEDLLDGGLFRQCDINKGGGGYDEFNRTYKKRFGEDINPKQFVVQLFGCPLRCDYCYVTREGVWGTPTMLDTDVLRNCYIKSGLDVLHLMGGAPALYLHNWKKLADHPDVKVFHSDFLCCESVYELGWLEGLPGLHAVSVKKETVKYRDLFFYNLWALILSEIQFYITFTGDYYLKEEIRKEFGEECLQDSFLIPINRTYSALR
jgi:hypothetical protein